jgi:diadenosine tetraphosphatase ApaH/serine/threonine PP2A family protein phosphatase
MGRLPNKNKKRASMNKKSHQKLSSSSAKKPTGPQKASRLKRPASARTAQKRSARPSRASKKPQKLTGENIIIAMGDVHAEYIVFEQLLTRIEKTYDLKTVRLILQELTDRGLDSQKTIAIAREFQKLYPDTLTIIQSNHDYANATGEYFELYTARAACLDYADGRITKEDEAFLLSFPKYYESRAFFFIHGGLPHGYSHPKDVPLDELVWKYGTDRSYQGEKRVVMGHTVVSDVQIRPKEIYIDTGATYDRVGKLSAVVLDDATGEVKDIISLRNESLFDTKLREATLSRRLEILKKFYPRHWEEYNYE